jgi:hypothetical protein
MAIAVAGAAVAQDPKARKRGRPRRAAARQARSCGEKFDGTVFHAQVLLDRAGFSPGRDRRHGRHFVRMRVKGSRKRAGLQVTGQLDGQTRQALLQDKAPSTPHAAHRRERRAGARSARFRRSRAAGQDGAAPLPQPARKIAGEVHTTPQTIIKLNSAHDGAGRRLGAAAAERAARLRSYQNVKPEVAQLLSDLNVNGQQPKGERVGGRQVRTRSSACTVKASG